MISRENFRDCIEEMMKLAATRLPADVIEKLKESRKREENPIAKSQLETIIQNLEVAEEKQKPLCQDTGVPIFFIKAPEKNELDFSIRKTIEESVKRATKSVPLRPNIVDPLTRKNSGDNTGEGHPLINYEFGKRENIEVNLLMKGAGSENWSELKMMNPTSDREDIKARVVELIKRAGGQTCPPNIIGIGLGGTADRAALLAKKALLRPLDDENETEKLDELEKEITEASNELGIGPMGLGGKTTVLGTKIEKAGCHTASLPLAINIQCWAERRSKAVLKDNQYRIEVPK